MNEPTRRDALRELAEKPTANLRVSTLVRQRLSDIEAAQVNGHSNTQIVEAINKELGVSIKLKTFEQALWRIRNPQTGKAASRAKPAPVTTVNNPQAEDSTESAATEQNTTETLSTTESIRQALSSSESGKSKLKQYTTKPTLGVKK